MFDNYANEYCKNFESNHIQEKNIIEKKIANGTKHCIIADDKNFLLNDLDLELGHFKVSATNKVFEDKLNRSYGSNHNCECNKIRSKNLKTKTKLINDNKQEYNDNFNKFVETVDLFFGCPLGEFV